MHYYDEQKDIITNRNVGLRFLVFSASSVIIVFAFYGYLISPTNLGLISIRTAQLISNLGLAVLLYLVANLFAIGYSVYRICLSEKLLREIKVQSNNFAFGNRDVLMILPILVNIVSQSKRYRLLFLTVLVVYAVIFAFISQIIIFRPDVSFSHTYQVAIPSWVVTPCCNFPGLVPTFTAYLSDNLIIYIIPINLVLSIVLSTLVSANIVLAAYTLQSNNNRVIKAKKRSYFSGVGATAGLFTACPICAGTFFSTLVGIIAGASTIASSTAAVTMMTTRTSTLESFQALFIIISITMLIISPYLTIKNMKKSYMRREI